MNQLRERFGSSFLVFGWVFVVSGSFVAAYFLSNTASTINPDIGWTLRNGYMAIHHWHQTTDTYTWTISGVARIDQSEWLTDTILYLLYSLLGVAGINLFTRVMVGFIFLLIVLTAKRYYPNRWAPIVYCVALPFALWMGPFLQDRPQIFSYALVLLYLLWRGRRDWVWFVLLPIWANLHGAYMVFFGLFLIDMALQRQWKKLVYIPVLVLEVGMFTPMHFFTLKFPFMTLFSHDISNYIVEWEPYPFHSTPNMIFFLIMIPFLWYIFVYGTSYQKVVTFMFFAMTMSSVRNEPLLALVLLVWVRYPKMDILVFSEKSVQVISVFLLLLAGCLLPRYTLNSLADTGAMQYIKTHHLQHLRWYINIIDASYVEMNIPTMKVYWDGRTDMYTGIMGGPNMFLTGAETVQGQRPIVDMPDYREIQGFAVHRDGALSFQLQRMSGWSRIYSDSKEELYLRKSLMTNGHSKVLTS